MLEGLNRGLPKLGIGKSNKVKRMMNSIKNVSNGNDEGKDNDKKRTQSIEFWYRAYYCKLLIYAIQ